MSNTAEIVSIAPQPVECPDCILIAGPRDEVGLADFLRMMHAENGMACLSEDKMFVTMRRGTQQQGGIIGIIRGPHGIEASIGMVISSWWYTDDFHLEEVWNYVHPDHRRSNHAKNLISFGKWCAEQMRLNLLMGILTTERTEAKARLYQRQIPQVGALFLYRVGDDGHV